MNCSDARNRIDDLLDRALDESAARALADHCAACADCRRIADRAAKIRDAVAALPVTAASEGFAERALAAAAPHSTATVSPPAARARPRSKAGRVVAAAFVGAFALSVLTVIYTGLLVEAPKTEVGAALPSVTLVVAEPRTINLVFGASAAVDDVTLLIDLPDGIEATGYAGQRRLAFSTQLQPGRNLLPLEVLARRETRGQLVARLQHGDRQKVFRVHLEAGPG